MLLKTAVPICLLLVALPADFTTPKPTKKPPSKVPSITKLLARVERAERLAKKAKQEAFRAKKYVRNISKKMQLLSKIDAVQGGFSDEKPCPNKIQGFYYSAKFKSCFYLAPSLMMLNWTEAEALCQRRHEKAHLVAIESAEKQQYLKTKWQNERGVGNIIRFWTSGHQDNGTWAWTSIDRPIQYNNWIPVTNHNNPGYKCLSVLSFEGFFWGDVRCWTRHMVTCEIRL